MKTSRAEPNAWPVSMSPDEAGVLHGEVLPGLALKPDALFSGELAELLAVLQRELASPEQVALVAKLGAARK